MNTSKVVHVPKRNARHLNTVYDLYASRIVKIERDYIESTYRRRTINVSCQCNLRRDQMCTCRRVVSPEPRYFSSPKQVYRYSDWHSVTDIGVGSIKALPRKRIRKIYLPETVERAVGSANLKPYIHRRSRPQWARSYYENKRTSSKCVGGFVDEENVPLVNKMVSPIIQKISGTTSLQKRNSSISTQINTNKQNVQVESKIKSEVNKIKSIHASKETLLGDVIRDQLELPTAIDKLKSEVVNIETCKDYSSDSLVQHVHNLENPSDDKQSKISVDPMENKLEREYRKIFTSKSKEKPSIDKPMSDFKSASMLRRRFEALRRGLTKKESKKETVMNKITSQASMASHKDVSIASDPPSLEGRSYSNTKIYSPYQSTGNEYKTLEKVASKKSPKSNKNKNNSQWLPELADKKYESVQGMFKLWGKKFNLDEDNCKTSPTISNDVTKNPEVLSKTEPPQQAENSKKKQGRKFFIFGKKIKDKESKPYKSKKGVTTGRCEVKDGLRIKVGGGTEYSVNDQVKKQENHLEKYDNILRKAWLEKYITNTRDSRNSVHIRWNNNMYGTSSSTILELMDSMYKHTGINIRSRSEVTTGESSNYHSYTKQRVHFMHQDIEAWMIPKLITNTNPKQSIDYRTYYHNNNKCRRWFVDASQGFPQKIELVLRSKSNSKSSEYLIINIPEGYFSHSSSELREQSSDEKIYKIVEYDTSELKKIKETRHIAIGDNFVNEIKVDGIQKDDKLEHKIPKTDPGYIQRTSMLRDVAIQGSNVFVPKRCDVIGVGIITQRDIRDVRNPILKIEDELSDEDSEEHRSTCQKKCELAESFLQDYCHNWMPSGIDRFSWHISDSQHSGNNSAVSLNQGDGTKSSPNVYDNFQESTILLSSCETSSCSRCIVLEDEKKPDDSLKSKFFNKFKKKSSESPMISDKRNCPKDSLEVHKRRQFYAGTDQRCKWFLEESPSLPSLICKTKMAGNQKLHKPCWKIPDDSKKKQPKNEKHVCLPGCKEMNEIASALSNKSLEGILNYKGFKCDKKGSKSPKCVITPPKSECQIPQPPCKETCEEQKRPPCTEKNSPPCDELFQPRRSPVPPCEMKPPCPPPTPPICIKPIKKSPCSTFNPRRQISNDSLQRKNPCILTKTPSGLSLNRNPSPKQSGTLPICRKKQEKKECKPNCANAKKNNKFINTPPTPPPTAYQMPHGDCTESSKDITGLHLKKLPSIKRTDTRDCYNSDGSDIIRLNSHEKFTIRMKKQTPSTEEIRENVNIKVQDEDGQTLFERIDYKKSGDEKCLILEDVYRSPQIQRVLTPITVKGSVPTENKSQNEIYEAKSNASVDNLIEINFTLKIKQGDKNTEVNINNYGDAEIKQKGEEKVTDTQKNVYIVQNSTEPEPAVKNNKDVNIKIVIKNYNTDRDNNNVTETYATHNTDENEIFNKRISDKFQTVSTGYSDIDQHAFSIHRATIDLTASVDKLIGAVSKQTMNITKTQIISSKSAIEHSVTDQAVNSVRYHNEEEISLINVKKSLVNNDRTSAEKYIEETDKFEENKSENKSINEESKTHITDIVNERSDEDVLYKKIRLRNRVEKKAMLKKLFRSSSAVKKPENRKRIKELIGAITSDSSGTEIAVTSNELTRDVTYGSLDPGYFRNTDSMKNYYRLDSELSNSEPEEQKLKSTKNNSEISDDDSDVSLQNYKTQGCMCSALATKLNISLNSGSTIRGCCCTRNLTKDKEIYCDYETNECLLDVKCCVDVETQSSKHVDNKLNSANISVTSRTKSVVIENTSVNIKKSIEASMHNFSNTYLPDLNDIKYYGIKSLDKNTVLGLSDDDMLVMNSSTIQKSINKFKRKKRPKHINKHAADILQLNETKKAVLEIYKERILSDEGEKLVAKLPKFDFQKENDITNFKDVVRGRRKISRRNFVMMTVNR